MGRWTPILRLTRRTDGRRLSLLALCAFAYLYVYPYFPGINNPNENVRFYMTAALVEQGTYAIDDMRERWGWVNDSAHFRGHFYSVKAPGTSLLGVPAYAAYRALSPQVERDEALWWCRLLASILPTLGFLWFLHAHLSRVTTDRILRDAVFVTVAVGSILYGYGLLFVSHTLSAASAFIAYVLLLGAGHSHSRTRALIAGCCCAGVTLLEYPGLVCSLPLAVFALWQLRTRRHLLFYFVVGGLLPTLAMMHFQYHAFGSPFTPGHLHVENDGLRRAHHQGLYGAVGPSWAALYGLLFHPGSGLFPLCPLLILSPPGAVLAYRTGRDRAALLCLGSLCLLTLLVIASMNNWRGGWTIGPRYLAVIIPFAALLSLRALDALSSHSQTGARALALSGAALGMWSSGALSAYYPHVPPHLPRPVAQLLPMLWKHDFAPFTASGAFGVYGSASMVPLVLCGVLMLTIAGQGQGGLRALCSAAPLCALGLWLTYHDASPRTRTRNAINLVTRTWSPAGHDQPSRTRVAWSSTDSPPSPDEVRSLAADYRELGRNREARALVHWQTVRDASPAAPNVAE